MISCFLARVNHFELSAWETLVNEELAMASSFARDGFAYALFALVMSVGTRSVEPLLASSVLQVDSVASPG